MSEELEKIIESTKLSRSMIKNINQIYILSEILYTNPEYTEKIKPKMIAFFNLHFSKILDYIQSLDLNNMEVLINDDFISIKKINFIIVSCIDHCPYILETGLINITRVVGYLVINKMTSLETKYILEYLEYNKYSDGDMLSTIYIDEIKRYKSELNDRVCSGNTSLKDLNDACNKNEIPEFNELELLNINDDTAYTYYYTKITMYLKYLNKMEVFCGR